MFAPSANTTSPTGLDAYANLAVGESLTINDHEPRGLKDEFDREFAGAFSGIRLKVARVSSPLPNAQVPHCRGGRRHTALLAETDPTTGGSI